DYTHPDLAEHIWVNQNEISNDDIDNDNNGYVDDVYGWDFYNDDASVCHYIYDRKTNLNLSLPEDNDNHGTHIAGVIAAVADNGLGVAGIASNIDIKLMILKINGGSEGTGSISDAILAIKYATKMGAEICNISWGTTRYSPALKETIKESDMLFVAAAGNLGSDNDNKPVYPASFKLDNLISVTFIDANGRLTKLSNYGKSSVEIAAPGTDIMSTVVGSYQTLSGSSMAAPHVSALASLLYSYDSNLYPSAIKNIIIETLKPITGLKDAILYPGIPNAYNALLEVGKIRLDITPPIIKLETAYDKGDIIVPIQVEDEGGSGVRVIRWLSGIREITDFNRGTTGLAVENDQINVSKAGTYTIYASDYAGNESIQIHEIEDDKVPPSITFSYNISEDYKTRTVNIRVVDRQSGIRRVKYLPGNKKESDFLPVGSGTEIKFENDRGRFNVEKDGIYTLYAIDNRGNHIAKPIDIRTVLSEDIKFTQSDMSMIVGDRYDLRAFVKPANTTDVIIYTSSNDRVALINNKGRIVALSEGTATVTARTNNGIKVICRIVVKRTP
ncbi:MAG TPA: S8 family serine peptidase, partial [Clostridiales bacterium]|nr:S8 family serine peptidase [Clostridiales bacterium]